MSGRISDVNLLDPWLLGRLGELMAGLAREKIPLGIYETARSPARQAELYAIGRDPEAAGFGRTVTGALPWHSAHQFGLGLDLAFRFAARWTWDPPEEGMWDRMQELAATVGLEPVRDRRGRIKEWSHVQLAGFATGQLPHGPNETGAWLEWLRERVAG